MYGAKPVCSICQCACRFVTQDCVKVKVYDNLSTICYLYNPDFKVKVLFNLETFDIKLETNFIGRNFIYAEEVDSTNSILLSKENKKYNIDGTVVLAEKQNKGRGRKTRVWYSARGYNLTFSILLSSKEYFKSKVNLLNFVAAIAVAHSVENLYQLRCELKWPNDVLINKKKIAGILLESVSSGNKLEKVVIGIGLNVNQITFHGNYNVEPTSLKIELENQRINRETLLAEILNNFEETLYRFVYNKKYILNEWKEHCSMIGERISITDGDKEIFGIFDDIDDDGFLLLKTRSGIEKIRFGDVTLSLCF